MESIIKIANEYFGEGTKGRKLPKGIYVFKGGYKALTYDEAGRTTWVRKAPKVTDAIRLLKEKRDGHHWFGVPHDVENNFGFTYRVTELDSGKQYIGSKQYRYWNGPVGGYKCTDVGDKVWFREDLWRPGDWEFYKTSSKVLSIKIAENPSNYLMETLALYEDKMSMRLAEIELLRDEDVLEAVDENGEYKYYNENIGGWIFRPPLSKGEMMEMMEAAYEGAAKYVVKPDVCICGKVIPYGGSACH